MEFISSSPEYLGESYCADHAYGLKDWLDGRGFRYYTNTIPRVHASVGKTGDAGGDNGADDKASGDIVTRQPSGEAAPQTGSSTSIKYIKATEIGGGA